MNDGFDDLNEELDFVKLHKRIRMHGVGLYYLLRGNQRRLVEKAATFRALKLKDQQPKKVSTWDDLENIDMWDRFYFAFLHRF